MPPPLFARCVLPLALLGGLSAPCLAVERAESGDNQNCFRQLERGTGPQIACSLVTRLTDEERRELQRLTKNLLQDAGCTVSVRIDRGLVDAALRTKDHDFEAPPQPVRCEVVTAKGTWSVTGTFAPRVVVRDGSAVDATPGLDRVEGVARAMAWPVVQYVNRSATLRDGLIRAVNAYLAHQVVTGRIRRAQQ